MFISRTPGDVWDYTQNYDNRPIWDDTVIKATVVQTLPNRIVQLKMKGRTIMTFVYKLDERPLKTTLAMKDITSPIIDAGGGSWLYEPQNNGTLWTQTNTIVFKKNILLPLLLPVYKWMFTQQTVKAMKKAKSILEKN